MGDDVQKLAEEHVEWLISFIVPLIRRVGIDEFIHGYKHGKSDSEKELSNEEKSG